MISIHIPRNIDRMKAEALLKIKRFSAMSPRPEAAIDWAKEQYKFYCSGGKVVPKHTLRAFVILERTIKADLYGKAHEICLDVYTDLSKKEFLIESVGPGKPAKVMPDPGKGEDQTTFTLSGIIETTGDPDCPISAPGPSRKGRPRAVWEKRPSPTNSLTRVRVVHTDGLNSVREPEGIG